MGIGAETWGEIKTREDLPVRDDIGARLTHKSFEVLVIAVGRRREELQAVTDGQLSGPEAMQVVAHVLVTAVNMAVEEALTAQTGNQP